MGTTPSDKTPAPGSEPQTAPQPGDDPGGIIAGPWQGRWPLWRALWFAVVPAFAVIVLLELVLEMLAASTGVIILAILIWAYWSMVSLWRCADPSTPPIHDKVPVLILFVAVFVSLVSWFLLPSESYTTKAKVQEGVSLSAPARTTFDILCSEGKLRPGLPYDDPEVQLLAPEIYTGEFVQSVSFSVPEQNSGRVVIVYKWIGETGWFGIQGKTYVEKGATVIYKGTCGAGGTTWSIDPASTVPKISRPKY